MTVLGKAWRHVRHLHDTGGGDTRWMCVTVDRRVDEVHLDTDPPAPLADLGDLIEVRVRPAPADKGTELAARLRDPSTNDTTLPARLTGNDTRQRVRAALRASKQLIEVGEVLRVDPTPHGGRSRGPAGKVLELATRRAGGEGLL